MGLIVHKPTKLRQERQKYGPHVHPFADAHHFQHERPATIARRGFEIAPFPISWRHHPRARRQSVHILASLAAKHSLSDLMRELKADSSGWIHKNFPNQKSFAWQIGYGAFSVSHSNLVEVEKYIANQEEHHRKVSFQEEFVAFLKKHEIEYDERFLWE
jgi:hypothetical protein